MQRIEARRVALAAVKPLQRFLDAARELRRAGAKLGEAPFVALLLQLALGFACGACLDRFRQLPEGKSKALDHVRDRVFLFRQPGAEPLRRRRENRGIGVRIDGKVVVEVADLELAARSIEGDRDLAALEREAVAIAEHRQQQLSSKLLA